MYDKLCKVALNDCMNVCMDGCMDWFNDSYDGQLYIDIYGQLYIDDYHLYIIVIMLYELWDASND